jgi:polyisoprenyl-teichoic acid--peptidoglycan teichoic acid transferase
VKTLPANRRAGALLRYALAALVVVAFAATITSVAGLLEFRQLAQDIGVQPAIKGVQVQIPAPGAPQTLLLIGSDHRAGEPYSAANSDTMMLVRIDASSSTINVLSIPRDLKVRIPGDGTAKLNAAYSVGGPNLILNILKTEVFAGLGFHVNHVIDENFRGFADLVDAIGCVYTDADHRYYNLSAPGPNDYSSIDIQPGYQKLCGWNQAPTGALAFVRFRHTDSDIVRNARQQDFLRWAKQNYTGGQLFSNRDKLLKIFGKNAQTDYTLHSAIALENLVLLLANSAGHQLKSIHFPAQFGACGGGGQTPCYVTADTTAEARIFHEFMTPTKAAPAPPPAQPARPPVGARGGRRHGHGPGVPAGLVADPADGRTQAAALHGSGMPVYYPKLIRAGANYCSSVIGNCTEGAEPALQYAHSYPRKYVIHASGGGVYSAYRMTIEINSALGEFYGIQGTTWQHPPILGKPTQTVFTHGKHLMEFFNGHKLSIVAWRTPAGVYWVSNTLTDDLPSNLMVAIAASLTRA